MGATGQGADSGANGGNDRDLLMCRCQLDLSTSIVNSAGP